MATKTDSFSGTGSLAAGWLRSDNAASDFTLDSGVRSSTLGYNGAAYWTTDAFSGDQYAEIEVGVQTAGEWSIGPVVKATAGTDNHYRTSFNASRIFIQKIPAGTFIIDVSGLSIPVGAVVRITAEASGADLLIKAWLNGSQVGSTYTDTSPHTGTLVGIGCYYTDTTYRGINFSGGDLAGGGSATITADQGSYTLTGQDAGLRATRVLTAEFGTYALTGQDATLTYVPAQAFSLTADFGSYTLTGQTAVLQKDTPGQFTLQVDAGSYAWTGNDALIDSSMNGEQGSYALNGQEVTFTRGYPQAYSMAANVGSYTFNGQNARLDWSGAPIVPNRQAGIYMGMRIGL